MSSALVVEQLLTILLERERKILALPTIAASGDIQNALEALPKTLPENGLGTGESLAFIQRAVLPGLAPGHAGPRYGLRCVCNYKLKAFTRYFGFVTGGVVPAALHGDILASIYDQNVQVSLPIVTYLPKILPKLVHRLICL